MRSRWDGFFGRYVISLALTSFFVVTVVALVNRGIDDRVEKIQRVAGLDVAPAPPGGANYLIIGSDTRAVRRQRERRRPRSGPRTIRTPRGNAPTR